MIFDAHGIRERDGSITFNDTRKIRVVTDSIEACTGTMMRIWIVLDDPRMLQYFR
jgi:hypothetical protein